MKKWYLFAIFVLCYFSFFSSVQAKEYETGELIPVGEVATVDTGEFVYQDIAYQSKRFNEKEDSFVFKAVKNKADVDRPFSINILLFDKNKINIGLISYCSSREIDGDYALLTISANASSTFSIPLQNRFFITGSGPDYLYYYAVMDSNLYCKKYAADRFKGLRMEEIKRGIVSSDYHERFPVITEFIRKHSLITFLFIIIGIVAVYFLGCAVQYILSREMFNKGDVKSFIPIVQFYVVVKLAIGPLFAIIYSILLLISFVIIFVYSNFVMFWILFAFVVLCMGFNVYKLISGKYGVFYFDPIFHTTDGDVAWKIGKKSEEVNDDSSTIIDLNYQTAKDNTTSTSGFFINQPSDIGVEDTKVDHEVDEKVKQEEFMDMFQ